MRFVLLLALCALIAGCSLSKDESTIARTEEAIKNRKKELPAGFFTEAQVGVKYYPDSDAIRSREYDEGGSHIVEVILSTRDDTDKVRDFYEKEIGAKAMPVMAGQFSIQSDSGGRHRQVDYGRFDQDTTITIKVSWPNG